MMTGPVAVGEGGQVRAAGPELGADSSAACAVARATRLVMPSP